MTGIQKYFPGVHALNNVRFDLHAGEVHALVGENGAGKSTLMKVLTGIYQMDGGSIEIMGKPVEIRSAKDAQDLGISIVHQELNLLKDLTVAENIYIGRENMNGILLDKKAQNKRAQDFLDQLNLNIKATQNVGKLTVAKQQMVEIAKALSHENTRILILDEPTAPLSDVEIEELFRFIRDMRSRGVGIIYISHRMGELKQISDRITVMRDGQYVDTVDTAATPIGEIIRMMVGRVIYEDPKTESQVAPEAPVVLEGKNLRSRDVKDVSFQLRKGEILGLAGLVGAGRTELSRLVSGADKREGGEIYINGQLADIQTPYDAVELGIGYLSEDRRRYGLCLGLSVANNIALTKLDSFIQGMAVNDRKIKSTAREYKEKVDIRTPSVDTLVRSLSGGNQQKVVISKWLVRNCDVLIFDEPTRGIDVGAKNEIYKLMHALVDEGKSIIMISSEMPELLRMADRILVMCEGEKTGELGIEEATQEKIMALAAPQV
ncbi:MAG: sugar ABC transporter ATP-binding protein [Clostridiales bacterium]|nr:sugar ABC transporter ATP-binding protein [Clostridiales bacterium]